MRTAATSTGGGPRLAHITDAVAGRQPGAEALSGASCASGAPGNRAAIGHRRWDVSEPARASWGCWCILRARSGRRCGERRSSRLSCTGKSGAHRVAGEASAAVSAPRDARTTCGQLLKTKWPVSSGACAYAPQARAKVSPPAKEVPMATRRSTDVPVKNPRAPRRTAARAARG